MSQLQTLRDALSSVVVVPVTPFAADKSADFDTYAKLCTRLVDAGISVLTPNGNTGEFYALTAEEAQRATEAAVQAANASSANASSASSSGGEAQVLVGVGHDIGTAIKAAQHAQQSGAGMIMIHQPVHPYVSTEGWIDYHAEIANAVPELGVVLYIRNERITGATIAALADRAPNVIGIKYGLRDATVFARVSRDAGLDRFTWLAGAAELTAPPFWAAGARGFTSGLANVAPSLSLELLNALKSNDFETAMKVWESVRRFEELRLANASADNVSVVKEGLAQLGLCRADVRPPSRQLPQAVKDEISGILASWGLSR